MPEFTQLISYIAPGAPATRRPATGREPFLRPEIGFTPRWYRDACGVDFGERWHANPEYRREAVLQMRAEVKARFPGADAASDERPLDLLTGTFGACVVAAIYGLPIHYAADNWPTCAGPYLDDVQMARLEPPDLDNNPFFQQLMEQVEWISAREGRVEGFINWQGVLNNAHRLRGEALFTDMLADPDACTRLFSCVCRTMTDAAQRLHLRQRETGVDTGFFTVSNCLVNLVAPDLYAQYILPWDRALAGAFTSLGVHNCAWTADPYLDHYATLPKVSYIDMGIDSDLAKARALFPHARRALMYTPTDLANKGADQLRADMERIAANYGPCDLVAADIELGTPDDRVQLLLDICREISSRAVSETAKA